MQVGKTQNQTVQEAVGTSLALCVKYRCHLKLKQKAPSVQEN